MVGFLQVHENGGLIFNCYGAIDLVVLGALQPKRLNFFFLFSTIHFCYIYSKTQQLVYWRCSWRKEAFYL